MMVVTPRRHRSEGPLRRVVRAFGRVSASPRRFRWAILGVMAFTLLAGNRGLLRLIGLLHDRAGLAAEVRRLERRATSLDLERRRHASDPDTIERVAREQLDLVRRSETVYKFPSSK